MRTIEELRRDVNNLINDVKTHYELENELMPDAMRAQGYSEEQINGSLMERKLWVEGTIISCEIDLVQLDALEREITYT